MHVLLVAYRFPPQGGGGVVRPLKFAKYLSRSGARVTVLTVRSHPGAYEDASLLQDLPPEVRVVAVRERRVAPLPVALRPRSSISDRARGRLRVGLRWALHHLMVPDMAAGFIGEAARAWNHPEIRGADVVLATAGPWSCFLAGQQIARRLRRPLVLDYRDPWTANFTGRKNSAGALARRQNPGLERQLLTRAAAVVSVIESFPRMLEEQLGVRREVHWIPNGYDPEDFEGLEPSPPDRFVLTYAGQLYGGRTLSPVLAALTDLARSGHVAADRCRLRVLGPPGPRVQAEFRNSPLAGCVEALGYLPHRETLAHLLGSTINLLVDLAYDGPNVHAPGKLYEYLRAGRPILSLSADGVTPDLIREAEGGWVVAPGDGDGLRETLGRAFAAWSRGDTLPQPRREVAERFDRSRIVQRLMGILEEVSRRRERQP